MGRTDDFSTLRERKSIEMLLFWVTPKKRFGQLQGLDSGQHAYCVGCVKIYDVPKLIIF